LEGDVVTVERGANITVSNKYNIINSSVSLYGLLELGGYDSFAPPTLFINGDLTIQKSGTLYITYDDSFVSVNGIVRLDGNLTYDIGYVVQAMSFMVLNATRIIGHFHSFTINGYYAHNLKHSLEIKNNMVFVHFHSKPWLPNTSQWVGISLTSTLAIFIIICFVLWAVRKYRIRNYSAIN